MRGWEVVTYQETGLLIIRGSTAQEVEEPIFLPFHIFPLAGGAPDEEPPPSLEGGAPEKQLLQLVDKDQVPLLSTILC